MAPHTVNHLKDGIMATSSNIGLLLKAVILKAGGTVKLTDEDIDKAKNVRLEAGRFMDDPDSLVIRIKEGF